MTNSFNVEADVFLHVTTVYFNPCEGKSPPQDKEFYIAVPQSNKTSIYFLFFHPKYLKKTLISKSISGVVSLQKEV